MDKKSSKANHPGNDKSGQPGGKPGRQMNFYWVYAIVAVLLLTTIMLGESSSQKKVQWPEFKEMAEAGQIARVTHNGHTANLFFTKEVRDSLLGEKSDPQLLQALYAGADASMNIPDGEAYQTDLKELQEAYGFDLLYDPPNEWGGQILSWVIFLGLMVVVWMFLMRRLGGGAPGGGQIFNIGKSKAQIFEKGEGTDVTFSNVAGVDGAKEELQEIVDFLKHPDKYTELGAKIPKGALLVGPPGTGKTLLAKAVAGEAQVPFFSLSGSDFVEMFVGVGASRVRDLFKQAKEKSPAIIFIDEIDAIGRARGKNANFGSNDERENTLNQLLTEMDGFGTNSGVIILAATNRADILDKALMRAGRFDRQIYVDMPDVNERKAIFDVHLRPIKTDNSVDIDFLSKQTPGFSGADIANVCNEAALFAARKDRKLVAHQDFLDAVDRIIGGLEKRTKVITENEKNTIAFHEAGHAVVSWLVEFASPLVKVSIVPRGQSLGAAWYLPEERAITTTEQIFDEMCAALGGRAAEEIMFGKISTGALSDLEKVTKQAYSMVSIYGLNERIGNRSYYDSRGENSFTKPYSEETARIIDEEVSAVIEKAYDRAKDILATNRDKLETLAQSLLDNEVIFKEDVERILGARPFASATPALSEPAAEPGTEPEEPIADISDNAEASENAPESPQEDA